MAKRQTETTLKRTEAPGRSQSFESSLAALEKIVRELERGDLPLEKSLELFEQGVRLSRECQERLNEADRRIEVLLRDSNGQAVLSAFDDEAVNSSGEKDEEEMEDDGDVF